MRAVFGGGHPSAASLKRCWDVLAAERITSFPDGEKDQRCGDIADGEIHHRRAESSAVSGITSSLLV